MLNFARKILKRVLYGASDYKWEDPSLIISARLLMASSEWKRQPNFADHFWIQSKEFRVYSQFGDDGIIQWLLHYLDLPSSGVFVEFGVGDYYESNTHFLLVNNGWSGHVIDGCEKNVRILRSSPMYWRHGLSASCKFITRDNIKGILSNTGFKKIDLLHIDLDGNDYWVLQSIDLSVLDPEILILEYNSSFGNEEMISIPYDEKFYRFGSHASGKYYGASLSALSSLAAEKGYYFVGCNSAGNNAYFLANRHERTVARVSPVHGFQRARFRDSRDDSGQLSNTPDELVLENLRGLPVFDLQKKSIVTL